MNAHRIHRVAKLTGLSKDVIRVWERRYGLLHPVRGTNRYRQYSDEDVALLRYLKSEMDKGASIGSLAARGREALLVDMRETQRFQHVSAAPFERLLTDLIADVQPLDRAEFERRLNGAVAVIPFDEALDQILLPLQERIGELWHDGQICVAVEHYVTNLVQQKMFAAMNALPVNDEGIKVVVACLPGELHEVGALTIAYRCQQRGYRAYYLGADVPIDSLASFCARVRPNTVLLSVPVAIASEELDGRLRTLEQVMPGSVRVVAGGRGAVALREIFEKRSITVVTSFAELMPLLPFPRSS